MPTQIIQNINLKMNYYMNYSNDSDKILLRSIAERDADALVELYNRTRLGLEKLKRFLSGVGYSIENIAT
jgi:hypothetical protein